MQTNLSNSWFEMLKGEFQKSYFTNLQYFLAEEKKNNYQIFPPEEELFKALQITPFEKVKVAILGQDPYHGVGQAHGLSFSVPKGIKIPPSLKNIYKELKNEFPEFSIPSHGDLTSWAKQGVLLLNATLTVRKNEAGSHQKKGWETFTDSIISNLSHHKSGLIFILWGNYAKQKEALIDSDKHFILKSAHPSPFSAHSGFFGSKPFGKSNEFLTQQGIEPINWLSVADEDNNKQLRLL